jgi:hypothetical protein
MSRQPVGLACQVDTQPIAYFLANSGATNAVDLDIIPNSRTGHEIFPVGLAAVNTPPVQRDNCNRRLIVPVLFCCFSWALLRGRFAQTKGALLIPPPVVDQSAGFSERV